MTPRPRTRCPWADVSEPEKHTDKNKYMRKMVKGIWIPKNPYTKRPGYKIKIYYCEVCDAVVTIQRPIKNWDL